MRLKLASGESGVGAFLGEFHAQAIEKSRHDTVSVVNAAGEFPEPDVLRARLAAL